MKTIFLKSNINNIWLYNKRISEKKSYKNNKKFKKFKKFKINK